MSVRACLALLCLGVSLGPLSAQPAGKKLLTLDRLYSLPSLIGTRPELPQWSPDSRHLAFLWNDQGMPFLDLWAVNTTGGSQPIRLTHMPHPAAPVDTGTDVAKLQAQASFETDHGIADVAWSADSKQIFFTLHGHLFSVVPGSEPKTVESSSVATLLPAPTAPALAYITASGALSLLQPASAHATPLYTPAADGLSIEEAHWSPDGTQLAIIEADSRGVPVRGIPDYLADEATLTKVKRPFPGEPSETRRLGIVSTAGEPTRWLPLPGSPMDLIFGVSWSPDGQSLLVDRSDLYIKHRRLLQINVASGTSTTLVLEDDPQNVTAEWWSAWAPDGKGIYYTSDQPPANDYAVFYKPVANGAPQLALAGNYAVFSSEIAPAAHMLFATANPDHSEQRQIILLDLHGKAAPHVLRSMPGTHTAVASPNGELLADIFSSDTAPPDLYLLHSADATVQRITTSPLPEFNDYQWLAATYVTFPNVHDGTIVHARMTSPPIATNSKPRAAILGSVYSNTARNQWGGRIYHPTWGLDQYLAQQGYVLLNPDIRGSSGYGRAFRQRLALDYGGIDVDDLYSAAQFLITSGTADPHRIGMWGSSYGGLLTTTSLFTHPETFQAGVAGAPATSLFHALTGEMRTMMDPQTHTDAYTHASAFLKSGGLQGHLMLMQGMRDDVVLFKDSVTLTERLILQGKDVTLTPLPDAPHGWDTQGLAQTRYAYRKLVDYFNRWIPPQ